MLLVHIINNRTGRCPKPSSYWRLVWAIASDHHKLWHWAGLHLQHGQNMLLPWQEYTQDLSYWLSRTSPANGIERWGLGDSYPNSIHLSRWKGIPTYSHLPSNAFKGQRCLAKPSECHVCAIKVVGYNNLTKFAQYTCFIKGLYDRRDRSSVDQGWFRFPDKWGGKGLPSAPYCWWTLLAFYLRVLGIC